MAVQKKLIILAITAMFMEVTMAATTYTVGSPNGGWDTSTDLTTWASTQSFFVGDSLSKFISGFHFAVFQYTPNHDVLEVNKADYDSCQTSNPISSDNSGATTIPLSSPGKRYFICGTNGHCGQGMKVEIDTVQVVTTAPPPPSPSTPPPASPATPPPASSPSPPAASPVSPPVSSPPPKASTPSPTESPNSAPTMSPPQSKPPMSSPPPSLTVPSTKSPASTPAPSSLVPPPPPSSAHKCSFQATLAMGVGFVMVFLAL